jgi:hypothetical protein
MAYTVEDRPTQASAAPAEDRPRPTPLARPAALVELALVGGLVLLAFALRWPRLWDVPVFTDEWDEIGVSLQIARGQALPLTNVNAILGALPNYLMAAWFGLTGGPTVYAPRLFVMTLAALQVVPTYLLARELLLNVDPGHLPAARRAGLAAGLLLAASGAHIVLNSHLAWAISTTPLFTTTALWLLVLARRLQSARSRAWTAGGPELALAGLWFGLALQTHVSVIPTMVGAALGVLVTLRRLVWTRWTVAAAVLFGVGYANMIAYNLRTGFETLAVAQDKSAGYDGGKSIPYSEKLADLGESLFRLLGGALDGRPSLLAFLADPILLLAAALALGGLVFLAWRGQALPLLTVVAVALLMPIFNNRYEPLLSGRYLSPLLPICYAAASVLLVLAALRSTPRLAGPWARAWAGLLPFLPVLLVSLYSLGQLQDLYGKMESSGRTNARLWRVLEQIQAHRQPGEVVVLDSRLDRRRLIEAGSGDIERVLKGVLNTEGIPYDVREIDDGWMPTTSGLLVLSGRETPRGINDLVQRLGLRAADGGPPPPPPDLSRASLYDVYRVSR